MISSVRYFRIVTVSIFFFLLFCGRENTEKIEKYQEDIVTGFKSEYFQKDEKIYSIKSDTGYYIDSMNMYILKNVEYDREDGEKVKIVAESSNVFEKRIEYFKNVRVIFSDSMVLYTNHLLYDINTDTLRTDDSIMIEKKDDRMLTKGFICFDNFKKTLFLSPVLIYDENK